MGKRNPYLPPEAFDEPCPLCNHEQHGRERCVHVLGVVPSTNEARVCNCPDAGIYRTSNPHELARFSGQVGPTEPMRVVEERGRFGQSKEDPVAKGMDALAREMLKPNDAVNHPTHYNKVPGVECIDVVRYFNFDVGNAIKYCWRAGDKDPTKYVEDLEKAIFYIKDEIKRYEKEGTR